MENHPFRYQPGTGRDSPFLFNHDLFIYFKTPLLPDPRIFLVIDFAHKHIVWSCTDFEWCIHCLVDNQLFACFGMLGESQYIVEIFGALFWYPFSFEMAHDIANMDFMEGFCVIFFGIGRKRRSRLCFWDNRTGLCWGRRFRVGNYRRRIYFIFRICIQINILIFIKRNRCAGLADDMNTTIPGALDFKSISDLIFGRKSPAWRIGLRP